MNFEAILDFFKDFTVPRDFIDFSQFSKNWIFSGEI